MLGIGAASKALERLGIEHEIVDAVEIDKYAITSFNAIHGTNFDVQDITMWDKDLDVDLIMHGSPCLTKDSLILTNKGYIPLEEIEIGDLVLTKSNTWHKVNKIFDNGIKPTIYLQGMGFENIHCTPEHKFYVREMKRIGHFSKRHFSEPYFIEANKIEKKHYLGVPVIQEEIPFYTDDLEFWYLIGLYLGDGWLKLGKGYDVVFGLNDNKIEKLKKNVKEENWKWSIYNERTVKKLRFANKEFYSFISKYIGTGSFEKHIPQEILCLPKKQLLKVYEGYLDSDGCNIKNTDKFQFSSVNRNLIYSMSLIINKLFNRPTQISLVKVKPQKIIENRIVNQHNWYMLRFNMNKHKQEHAFYENNYIWYPFTKIENGNDENVYNMEIDTDHSYIVQGCISKNCQDFSVAGKQAGGDVGSGTRSSLMYETIRIVGKLRPKYVVWENVKNLLSKKHKHNFDAYIETMNILGYNSYYQVLNAKDYSIPQNRERVFTISIRKDIDDGSFKFPEKEPLELRLKDMLEEQVDEKYYLSDKMIKTISIANIKNFKYNDSKINLDIARPLTSIMHKMHRAGQDNYISDILPTNYDLSIPIKNATKKGYDEAIDGVAQTLQCNDSMGVVLNPLKDKSPYGWHFEQNVYDVNGITRSIKAGGGSGNIPKAILEEPSIQVLGNYMPSNHDASRIVDSDGLAPTVKENHGTVTAVAVEKEYERTPLKFLNRNQKNIDGDYAFCVDSCNTGGVKEIEGSNLRIRKLTPKECWRLMGFDDSDFEKARNALNEKFYKGKDKSSSQLYKQAGNSIVVNVLEKIFKNLLGG